MCIKELECNVDGKIMHVKFEDHFGKYKWVRLGLS